MMPQILARQASPWRAARHGDSGVGDEGGALLEGAVDEAVVGALAEDAKLGRGSEAAAALLLLLAHAAAAAACAGPTPRGRRAATARGPWRSRFPVLVCGRGAGVLPTRAGM